MDEIISRYTAAFDELNILTATSYYSTADIDQIVDDILSFLIRAYTLGIQNAGDMLGSEIKVDVDKMRAAIYAVIEGKTFEDRVIDHVLAGDIGGLTSLAENEFTRVYNAAVTDGGLEVKASLGNGVIKTWITVGDDKVRDTHSYLEGNTVDVEEDFWTYDGDHAPYPHGFSKAENNVGCRCSVTLHTDVSQI